MLRLLTATLAVALFVLPAFAQGVPCARLEAMRAAIVAKGAQVLALRPVPFAAAALKNCTSQ